MICAPRIDSNCQCNLDLLGCHVLRLSAREIIVPRAGGGITDKLLSCQLLECINIDLTCLIQCVSVFSFLSLWKWKACCSKMTTSCLWITHWRYIGVRNGKDDNSTKKSKSSSTSWGGRGGTAMSPIEPAFPASRLISFWKTKHCGVGTASRRTEAEWVEHVMRSPGMKKRGRQARPKGKWGGGSDRTTHRYTPTATVARTTESGGAVYRGVLPPWGASNIPCVMHFIVCIFFIHQQVLICCKITYLIMHILNVCC